MERCPKCGRYMTWYMVQTNGYWKCVCGYDTRTISYTCSNRTDTNSINYTCSNRTERIEE